MTVILSTEEMRAVEEAYIKGQDQAECNLMERAGQGAAETILNWQQTRPQFQRREVHVLCGPGNNGGDGFVVARRLHEAGRCVHCWEIPDQHNRSYAATQMRALWKDFHPIGDLTRLDDVADGIVVDALFGTGLKRPLDDRLCTILKRMTPFTPVVAIDILSGLDSDTGMFCAVTGLDGFQAELTITFQQSKWGHHLGQGSARSGYLEVVSIGLEKQVEHLYDHDHEFTQLYEPNEYHLKRHLTKRAHLHKYDHGHALVLSGGLGRAGASKLAGLAALRVGAGLVTLGAPPAVFTDLANQVQALMATKIGCPDDLASELSNSRINAICVGPGLGLGIQTKKMVSAVLKESIHVVLDADALTSFASNPAELFRQAHRQVVLTPHLGEFSRLFPAIADQLVTGTTSRVQAVREASQTSHAIVLLKGTETVIANPEGRCMVCPSRSMQHSAWLATAGSGDVLAGMITGLMARNIPVFDACTIAVHLHLLAANHFGPGLVAEDLPLSIAQVLNRLLSVSSE